MATQSTSSTKTPWGKIGLGIIVIAVLISWIFHIGPFHRNYTMTANLGGVQIQLTPITPPKALSTLPSDYVQVVVKVGMLTFSTDDPQYKCLESLIPLFFKEETLFPNVILVAYENCGQLVHTEHERLAMLSPFLPNSGNLYAMFNFPDNSSTLCSSNSSQCIDFATPTPVPTPTALPPTPTVSATGPSGQSVDPIAANIITNAQMTTTIDPTTFEPTNPTSTFQTGQTIYVTFDLHLPSAGYFIAKWYENNNLLSTSPAGSFNADAPRGEAPYQGGYTNPGNGTVELYWCTQPDCSDAKLASFVNFTVA